jgi:cystathionine beta-lyase/cystathionine gamma-synthase
MKFETKVVHSGDRKRTPPRAIPSTTPIYLSSTYFYDTAETLDRIFGHEEDGPSYSRYANPTNDALEELTTELEGGFGSLATCSGMTALQLAFQAALMDKAPRIVSASAIYGATMKMLDVMLAPFHIETTYVDICDLEAVKATVERVKPGCIFMESISNPVLRVGDIAEVAKIAKANGATLIVDSTFSTPMLQRPLAEGANMVVHSATKFFAGHGDVLGGIIVSDEEHHETVRTLSRVVGGTLGPFESYLTMRGIKTLALRFERQCQNAAALAQWLSSHPLVDKVNYCGDPNHPDAAAIKKSFAPGLYGAILSFEIKGADRAAVMKFMNRLKLVVPGTSLGDVHTLLLYPVIASHRDVAPKLRERQGIRDNLVRISAGIEALEDIKADLDAALYPD